MAKFHDSTAHKSIDNQAIKQKL